MTTVHKALLLLSPPQKWKVAVALAALHFCLPSFQARAQENKADSHERKTNSEIDRAHTFLKKHLVGRTFETTTTTAITGSPVEAEFHRRTHYQNLNRTPDSMTFDAVFLIKQKNFDLDDNGKRLDRPPQVQDRVLVVRYAVQQLKSNGKLVGLSRVTTSSRSNPTGSGSAIEISVADGQLLLKRFTPLYTDVFAAAGGWKTSASQVTSVFRVQNGKVQVVTRELGFDVDPDTLDQKPNGHDVTLRDNEIESLW